MMDLARGFSPLGAGTKKPHREGLASRSFVIVLTIIFSLVFGNWLPFRKCGEGPVVLRPTLSSGLPFRTRRSGCLLPHPSAH